MVVAKKLLKLINTIDFKDNNSKKFFVDNKIKEVIIAVYVYYVYKNSKEAKNELLEFDANLKANYLEYYRGASKSNIVKTIRISNGLLYKIIAVLLNR